MPQEHKPCVSCVIVDFSIHYTCWTVPRTRNFRMRIRKKYFYNRFCYQDVLYIIALGYPCTFREGFRKAFSGVEISWKLWVASLLL